MVKKALTKSHTGWAASFSHSIEITLLSGACVVIGITAERHPVLDWIHTWSIHDEIGHCKVAI